MGIGSDIKQKRPFRNPWEKVMVNIMYTNNWLVEQIKNILKPHGITLQQYNVLRILRGAGEPVSTAQIRESLIDKMSDTPRMVQRLYSKGLVEKNQCKTDKRLVDIVLSSKGHSVLKRIDDEYYKFDDIFQSSLSDENAEHLSDLLDKARKLEK